MKGNKVTPLVGAWIEMTEGMDTEDEAYVAPLVGAWIEIENKRKGGKNKGVAPLVGAWIEITKVVRYAYARRTSLPSWERGLKFA